MFAMIETFLVNLHPIYGVVSFNKTLFDFCYAAWNQTSSKFTRQE